MGTMPTFTKNIALRQTLKRALNSLDRDERGISLTEFVICLPVFLVIFIGIVNLNKLQVESMAVKMRASHMMWAQAIPVQKSTFGPRMLPSVQGITSAAHIGSHFRYPVADTVGLASAAGLGATGHFGESYALTKPIDLVADIWFSPPSFNLWDKIELDPPNHDHTLSLQGGPVYNNQALTRDFVDDGTIKSLPSGSGPLGYFNNFVTVSGARPAIAAGIRYGLAFGSDEGTVSFSGQTMNVSAGYDVLVAPKPTSEVMTTAVTRLGVESYKDFKGVLGIEWSNKL
jgi:hypothetical protein